MPLPVFQISPLLKRKLDNFKQNRRGYYSLWTFLFLFALTLPAEFIANDTPLLIKFEGQIYYPIFISYPETSFGGDFETEPNYKDSYIQELINENGWMIWPLIPYRHDTIIYTLGSPAPSPPDRANWLGTDDQARDVSARLIYGYRISVLFGLTLTICGSIIGILEVQTRDILVGG